MKNTIFLNMQVKQLINYCLGLSLIATLWSCTPGTDTALESTTSKIPDSVRKREVYTSSIQLHGYLPIDKLEDSYFHYFRLVREPGNGLGPTLILTYKQNTTVSQGEVCILESSMRYFGESSCNRIESSANDSTFIVFSKMLPNIKDEFRVTGDRRFGIFDYYVLEYIENGMSRQIIYSSDSDESFDPAHALFKTLLKYFPPFIIPTNMPMSVLSQRDTLPLISICK